MEGRSIRSDFAAVLSSALALPPDDQARLCTVLQCLTDTHAETALPLHSSPDELQLPSLQEWLQQMRSEPVWTQLLLVDEALLDAAGEHELAALQAARARLLQANPPVAVRRAVVELASKYPVGVCAGAVGLLVAAAGLGRNLLRLLF